MRKTLKTIALCLAIMGSGIVVTSCDEENSWFSSIINVLQNVLGITGTGSTYTYAGTLSISMYDYNATNNTYDQDSRVAKTFQTGAVVDVYESDGAVIVKLGDMNFNGTTVADFQFTTYWEEGKIDPEGPNYLTGGTCTYNGTQDTECAATAIQGTYGDQLSLTTIYFQVGDKLFMGTFSGTIEAE